MNQQRGTKRICASCGTRFYDFMLKPVCPKCNIEFIIPEPPPPARPRRPMVRDVEPARIVAGSDEDVPEMDDEDSAPAPDEESADEAPEEKAREIED